MKAVKIPIQSKVIFFLHNAILSVASAYLLGLFLENLIPMIYNHGLFYAICDEGAYTPRMELLYYINYLFKYWELADTVFLVLKKKQLEFLHVYHHAAVSHDDLARGCMSPVPTHSHHRRPICALLNWTAIRPCLG